MPQYVPAVFVGIKLIFSNHLLDLCLDALFLLHDFL